MVSAVEEIKRAMSRGWFSGKDREGFFEEVTCEWRPEDEIEQHLNSWKRA